MPNVHIILLNWNGWKDTIHCLESLLRSSYENYHIIVCDNDSTDNSLDNIKQWMQGKLQPSEDLHESLRPLVFPPLPKPISDKITILPNGSNNGFSAGNNPGIKAALDQKADYIWLLNNDTLVEKETLKNHVDYMEHHPKAGLCGSVIRFANSPADLQTYGGGKITTLTGTDRFVAPGKNIDFVSGTSLFMRNETVQQVGLLDEAFFFYWEDVDYSTRALNKGWQLATVKDAIIYHKFSASVGSQSLKSDLFKIASLKTYFKKHHPRSWLIPVTINITGMLIKRIYRKQWNRLKPILNASGGPAGG